jgi:DHA1 family multidrug resistance protein-like MFS transporter
MTPQTTNPNRVVNAVAAAVFVQWAGAAAVLPMLPLFLRREHTSVGLVGVVMASFFAAGVLTQYAAGHLSDRVGHRRVMLGGLAVYAVSSFGFLLSIGAGGYVFFRALQGLGAGALEIAGLALVSLVVPLERRGRAFSKVFAAQLSGMALGPVVGSVIGLDHVKWLFVISGVSAVVAMWPVIARTHLGQPVVPSHVLAPLRISRGLIGVIIVGVVAGLCAGVYETCWSLLMTSRGAAQWQIGLSWTLFAVSFAVASPVAGRLSDRLDRRWVALWASALSSSFILVYAFLPQPVWLMGLGLVEAVGSALAFPAAQSLLSQMAHPEALGRAQGLFTTAQSAAMALGAGVSGYLFAVTRWAPFIGAGVLAMLLLAALPWLWRDVIGRASDVPALDLTVAEPVPVAVRT